MHLWLLGKPSSFQVLCLMLEAFKCLGLKMQLIGLWFKRKYASNDAQEVEMIA